MIDKTNLAGQAAESWLCVDCGVNTAPGLSNRAEMEVAAKALGSVWDKNIDGIQQHIGPDSEVYTVRASVWKKAGFEGKWGEGCLSIGCLENGSADASKPRISRPTMRSSSPRHAATTE
jgi:hypothetical protein